MRTIQISDEDSKFLEDLQHELNTQTNDGNADPVYWGVMETREVGVPDGCGDERIYLGDGGTETLEGAVAYIAEYIVDDENMEAWNEVDKTNTNDVIEFCREKLGMSEVRIIDVAKKSEISRYTGAFLTKRACQQYIDSYGYNHSNPHTYAMTAYRNFELEHLLKILKTMELKETSIQTPASCASAEMATVDLGLPSGLLWADRNIGARSPEDCGAYFSWGNVEPHYPKQQITDRGDDDDTFDYDFSSEEYEKTPGFKIDGNIDAKHDAATVNLGESWRMPTKDDFQELYDNCEWVHKTVNGVDGYLVTSKINGSSIFFPCSGLGTGTSRNYRGSIGYYWSASFNSARHARSLLFDSGGVYPQHSSNRYYGFAVRPVQNFVK